MDKKYGSYLAELRNKQGYSQADIARFLGYTTQMISNFEREKAFPDLSTWSTYANLLGVDLKSFLNFENKKNDSYCADFNFNNEKFANNLKNLRKKAHLTQKDVAMRLEVNDKTIMSWEKGKSYPSLSVFLNLCSLYKLEPNELYFATQNNQKEINEVPKKKPVKPLYIILSIVVPLLVVGISLGVTLPLIKEKQNAPVNTSGDINDSSSLSSSEDEGLLTYTYQITDAQGYNNPNQTMKAREGTSRKISSSWPINNVEEGHYKLKISIRTGGIDWDARTFYNMYSNDPAPEIGDKEDEDPWRYWVEIDDAITYPDNYQTWGELGLIYEEFKETTLISNLYVPINASTIKLVHGDIGFSCYIAYIKLIQLS